MWKLPYCGDYIDFPKGVMGGRQGQLSLTLALCVLFHPSTSPSAGIPGLHCTPAAAASSRALLGAGSSCVNRGTAALPGFVLLICLGFLFRFDFRG